MYYDDGKIVDPFQQTETGEIFHGHQSGTSVMSQKKSLPRLSQISKLQF